MDECIDSLVTLLAAPVERVPPVVTVFAQPLHEATVQAKEKQVHKALLVMAQLVASIVKMLPLLPIVAKRSYHLDFLMKGVTVAIGLFWPGLDMQKLSAH